MNARQDSLAILDSMNEVNAAIAELIGSSSRELRATLIPWIKADIALLEELRVGMTERLTELSSDAQDDNRQCSDTLLSALDSAIATKCLALATLRESGDTGGGPAAVN